MLCHDAYLRYLFLQRVDFDVKYKESFRGWRFKNCILCFTTSNLAAMRRSDTFPYMFYNNMCPCGWRVACCSGMKVQQGRLFYSCGNIFDDGDLQLYACRRIHLPYHTYEYAYFFLFRPRSESWRSPLQFSHHAEAAFHRSRDSLCCKKSSIRQSHGTTSIGWRLCLPKLVPVRG